MKAITEDDLKIFSEEHKLHAKWRDLERDWLEEVKKSHQGSLPYEATHAKLKKYKEAFHNWQKFHNEYANILLAEAGA
ncbi:MAG: hypothetical protein H0U57_01865 [Tatlockia sp.]|nr:hypothetical protein [Tatlockia sp.]